MDKNWTLKLSKNICMSDLNKIVKQFGISNVEKAELLSNGSSNINWLCYTNMGKYVVKKHNYVSENFLTLKDRIFHALSRNQIPFVSESRTIHGETYIKKDNTIWTMRPYIEGRFHALGSEWDNEACVHALLAIHRIRKYGSKHIPVFRYWLDDAEYKLKTIESIISLLSTNSASMIEHYYAVIEKIITDVRTKYEYGSSIIHGDFHSGNIIFEEDDIKAIIDWDMSSIAPRVMDIAKAAFMLTRKGHGSFEINQAACVEFLLLYDKYSELSIFEIEAIPLFLSTMFIPTPEYLMSFSSMEKRQWYIDWAFRGSLASGGMSEVVTQFKHTKYN